jgi:phage terminase small subunit
LCRVEAGSPLCGAPQGEQLHRCRDTVAEERSAGLWRAASKHPAAPRYLSRDARNLWKQIVEARPADYFQPGSQQLLEQFCETMVSQRVALAEMAQAGNDPDRLALAVKTMKNLATVINSTAIKLRISIQAEVDRKSGKLDEKEPDLAKPSLLGGRKLRVI